MTHIDKDLDVPFWPALFVILLILCICCNALCRSDAELYQSEAAYQAKWRGDRSYEKPRGEQVGNWEHHVSSEWVIRNGEPVLVKRYASDCVVC